MEKNTDKVSALGHHWLLECYDCDAAILKEYTLVEELLKEAAVKGGMNIIETRFHQFEPWGVSGFIIVSESHLSIHTWPEHQFAAIDIFSCQTNIDLEAILGHLKTALKTENINVQKIERGLKKYFSTT